MLKNIASARKSYNEMKYTIEKVPKMDGQCLKSESFCDAREYLKTWNTNYCYTRRNATCKSWKTVFIYAQ